MLNGKILCFSISLDGTIIVSCTFEDGLCHWDAIEGELIEESVNIGWHGEVIWTNNDCAKIFTWSRNNPITFWTAATDGGIHSASTFPLLPDVAACSIDMKHGLAVFRFKNGAVSVCDIHV